MKYLIVIFISAFLINAQARTFQNQYSLSSADFQYTVHYILKTVYGHNKEAKGKALCKKDPCEFLVAAEVAKFDSGDSNRDLHMREVTKAALYPIVTVRGKVPHEIKTDDVKLDLEVELSGVKQTISQVPFHFKNQGKELEADGDFKISLKQFKIKAPSLMGIEIDDIVPIKIKTVWKPET